MPIAELNGGPGETTETMTVVFCVCFFSKCAVLAVAVGGSVYLKPEGVCFVVEGVRLAVTGDILSCFHCLKRWELCPRR